MSHHESSRTSLKDAISNQSKTKLQDFTDITAHFGSLKPKYSMNGEDLVMPKQ
jgi:hypothetical protein